MRFDSFQLKYNQGQSQFGKLYIDDFRIVENVILSTHEINSEQPFSLGRNSQTFNSSTEISFSVQNKTLFIFLFVLPEIKLLIWFKKITSQVNIK